jgi:TPR repeat protein
MRNGLVKTGWLRLTRWALLPLLVLAGSWVWAQTEIDQLRARAERGELAAELKLAQAYFMGNGVPRNQVEAARWFRKAAEQGEPQSERILGLMYKFGSAGFPKDESQAAIWFRKAAGQNDILAQNELGELYENGRGGLPKDDAEAFSWYHKAADQGSIPALDHAARLCVSSLNPQVRDPNLGVEYARKAVAADGKNPLYLSTLALALSVEGEFAEAVETQRQALELALNFQKAEYRKKLEDYQRAWQQSQQEPARKTAWPQE